MGRLLNIDDREGIWPRPDGLFGVGTANVGAGVVSGINNEEEVVKNDELDGVTSKGIASRLRLVFAERGSVWELVAENEEELDDGGGKNDNCDAGTRRMVKDDPAPLTLGLLSLRTGCSSTGCRDDFSSSCVSTKSFALWDLSNGM